MPPLEAMACGTPTVVSSSASLPEVCGNAAHYVDPNNFNDIAEGILKVINDKNYSGELVRIGEQRVKQFKWNTSTKSVLNIIRSELITIPVKNIKVAGINAVGIIKSANAKIRSSYSSK